MANTELSHRFGRLELLPHDEQIRVLKSELERINKWNLRMQRALERLSQNGEKDKENVLKCLKNDGVM